MKHADENVCPVEGSSIREIASHIIDTYDGDAGAAIESLLRDIETLQERLVVATAAISPGYTRGWMPIETADDAS
ncbi:hypothetical protein [Agrobacterium vitis]|uniref:hypothetical protein n=1 Tax=Agrobacterium vitis TaxID=373 RepID=UPI0012E73A70|nr:hypothetical protein [Agrobacterium vitis]MUZ65356.1 hypothetical protein [Agrobacterium vitis]